MMRAMLYEAAQSILVRSTNRIPPDPGTSRGSSMRAVQDTIGGTMKHRRSSSGSASSTDQGGGNRTRRHEISAPISTLIPPNSHAPAASMAAMI